MTCCRLCDAPLPADWSLTICCDCRDKIVASKQRRDGETKWAAEYVRRRQRHIDHFRKDREKALLRKRLMAAHPYCDNCGCRLQGHDREQGDYASVVVRAEKLACHRCVNVVRDLARAENADENVVVFATGCEVPA